MQESGFRHSRFVFVSTPFASSQPPLSPSQLNALARDLLEGALGNVWLEGELSGVSRPASGHLYFALKDARAQVRCALFKPKSQWLRFRPVDGMRVLARGRLTLYEPRGEYQLVLDHLEEAGEGALRRALEELKARLDAEGLFAAARKKPLPARIERLGVLSSPGGAAVHDVLTVLRRRFPLIEVELLPVPVQGTQAAAQIVRMLERADASGRYDALLLARGGGSLEDLAAFNDEVLARAIAAANTPLVCAVGHEIDFSIADFAADLRAATPSAAAELITPDRAELLQRLDALHTRLELSMRRAQERRFQRLDANLQRLQAQHPRARLLRGNERLSSLRMRLALTIERSFHAPCSRLENLQLRLAAQHPALRLPQLDDRAQAAMERLRWLVVNGLERGAVRLAGLGRAMNAISPLATLERGYALVLNHAGVAVRSAEMLEPGQCVELRFADGIRRAKVLE